MDARVKHGHDEYESFPSPPSPHSRLRARGNGETYFRSSRKVSPATSSQGSQVGNRPRFWLIIFTVSG